MGRWRAVYPADATQALIPGAFFARPGPPRPRSCPSFGASWAAQAAADRGLPTTLTALVEEWP